jgi:predicted PurR-regulated permease PerM
VGDEPEVSQFPRPADRERNDLQTFAAKVLIVIAALAMVALLWSARDVVLLVFIAAVLAAGIAPAVRRVRLVWRFSFRRPLRRGAAVTIVYLPFLLLVVLICVVIIPRFVADTTALGRQLPELIDKNVLVPLSQYVPVETVRAELRQGIELPRSRVFAYMRTTVTAMASVVAVLFMVAYMLIDAERLRNLLLLVYPPEMRRERRGTMNRMAKRMSSWLSAQLLLAAIIGVASYLGFVLIGVPYALPLAIVAAVGEVIPVIGPTLAAVPAVAIALLGEPWQFWTVLIFVFMLQRVENLFIVPRLMSKKVQISPLAVFVAFLLGASVLGVVGAILAIPVAAIVQVAFEEAFVARRERRQDVDRAGTLLRKAD